ncbi:MAG: YjbQ family protein [Chlorobi bacterium]|nr:YjbQ family protein [Chlorobiota bacterium]
MVQQTEFTLSAFKRGCHLITSHIVSRLPELPDAGLLQVFIKHTSAGLTLNENADPSVRRDMDYILDNVVPARDPGYVHTLEGDDDMPAHAKSSLIGSSVTIPITSGRLNLGTWQGIYLCEFRDYGGPRKIVVTIVS